MKIYNLQRTQFLPLSIKEAWAFFSSPANLAKITPEHMGFKILHISEGPNGKKMYQGQLIRYKVNVLPGIAVHWVTEITHVSEPNFFVDEQRFGPYSLWHHQHHFKVVEGGVEMRDEVNYAIPFGILGRLANWLFVERQVHAIFEHRFNILEERFSKIEQQKEKVKDLVR
ncbi:MAG TPA: SRPBCC family protein [Cyclobacteriaceae bacterium]|nr:SRPBCC family protein [Cyclobacteriaceae bacterium]